MTGFDLATIYLGFLVTLLVVAGCYISPWPKRPIEWLFFAGMVIPTTVLAIWSVKMLCSIQP